MHVGTPMQVWIVLQAYDGPRVALIEGRLVSWFPREELLEDEMVRVTMFKQQRIDLSTGG